MRVAEITTRIVRVIEVPRSQLADFLKMPEAQQVGVYFLMGELSEAGLPRAYIGQSGNVYGRIAQHMDRAAFSFDTFAIQPCEPEERIRLEAEAIRRDMPRWNREIPALNGVPHERRGPWAEH